VTATGEVIGCARLTGDGSIGRMAVLKPWRGMGVGGALLLGYKTKAVALVMAIYVVALIFLLKLPLLQYLAIAGGLLLLHTNPNTACSLDNLKK
jgi:uncharacterized membrane protein YphA (DoxX/SURF4 family)